MRPLFSICSLLWPVLVTGLLSGLWIVWQPESLSKDAAEYHALAESILHGSFELNGAPTMLREPLYPLFRAMAYAVGIAPDAVAWVQVLLLMATVWLCARAAGELDRRFMLPTAWASSLFPGFLIAATRPYAEALTAFFLALAGWAYLTSVSDDRRIGFLVLTGIAAGAAGLTRGVYQWLGFFLAAGIWLALRKQQLRERIMRAIIVVFASMLIILPWMVRNQIVLGEFAVTQRAGIVLHTRLLKAQEPWERLVASYGSAITGRATVQALASDARPIAGEIWVGTWQRYQAEIASGASVAQADARLLADAKHGIVSDPQIFLRYAFWTPVDTWRLLALPSPLTPVFPIEGMFIVQAQQGALSLIHTCILLIAHGVEWIWIFGTLVGVWIGFRRYGSRFIPGWIVGYTVLLHLPTDNIVRYGLPVIPWRMTAITIAVIVILEWRAKQKTSR